MATTYGPWTQYLWIPRPLDYVAEHSHFRGINLGSNIDTFRPAIANGTFDELYIGDYFQFGTHKWYVAHHNYLNPNEVYGGSPIGPNIALIADHAYGESQMFSSAPSNPVFTSSLVWTTLQSLYSSIIGPEIGTTPIVAPIEYPLRWSSNIITTQSSRSMIQILGGIQLFGQYFRGISYDHIVDYHQMNLFKCNQYGYLEAKGGSSDSSVCYWLKDLYTTNGYTGVSYDLLKMVGFSVTTSLYIRPLIYIGG